ncbi:probable chitinase 10, partial [Drosophila eugracilis]|uniref:probable chitinase 10 n=1 Tax=Drosophila eugracilis TaxID=29029 RepID=UPI001BDA0B84
MLYIGPCKLLMLLTMIGAPAAEAHIGNKAHDNQRYSNYKPAFVRSAVESIPLDTRFITRPEFIPTIYQRRSSDIRSFVRDSVESAPSDEGELENINFSTNLESYDRNIDVDIKQKNKKLTQHQNSDRFSISDKYPVIIAQQSSDDFIPMPYRAGSQHQQLLKTMNDEMFKQIDETDRNTKHQTYGGLGQEGLKQRKDLNTTKVLCYMSNWAFYRRGEGHFLPEQIDPKLCSILIYSFASLDPDHLTIKPFDPWVDLDNNYFHRIISLGVPVLIALGGWTDSNDSKYSRLASDYIKRRVFASSAASFLKRYGFSGLHLDWNYPKCWQSDCSKGPASDKPNLTKLLRELRSEFNRVNRQFQVGVSISGYKEIITEAYEISALSEIVDYMTVMTYDYHGAWEQQTGHVSPLYGSSLDKYPQYNTDYTMQLLIKMGARREKLVLSIPFYGQSFTLAQSYQKLAGVGVSASGPGEAGEWTKQPGMLAYYEICIRLKKDMWMSDRDATRGFEPYAMRKDQWVGYEDPISVAAKARYAADNHFAGVAAWTIDLDDFQNYCCSGSYTLLKAINKALGRWDSKLPNRTNCDRPPLIITPLPSEMITNGNDGSSDPGQSQYYTTSRPIFEASNRPSITTTKQPMHPNTTKEPKTTTTISTIVPWWSTTTKQPGQTMTSSKPTHITFPMPAAIYPVLQNTNCESGEFFADSKNCNAYYHCITAGEMLQHFCPGSLHWNNEAKGCDWPTSAKCSVNHNQESSNAPLNFGLSSKNPITTSKPSRKPTESVLNHLVSSSSSRPQSYRPRPSDSCIEGEYYTHKSCEKYNICVNEALVPGECGGDLHWDAINKICNWPEKVQCVTSKKYLKIIEDGRTNEEDPCNGEDRVPYPGDCSKYLLCLWNRLQAGDCPPGLHYSENIGNCDWPEKAMCNHNSSFGSGETGLTGDPNPPTFVNPPLITQKPSSLPHPIFSTEKPVMPLDGYYKVVCYFTNWAWYRKGLGRYTPEDINTDMCTHIVYGFAVLDYSDLILRTHDSWADIDNNFYTRVSSLKSKGIKVSLALGGWNDSQGDKYSRLVRSPMARARFVRHALEFIKKYGFEGLDLDWEYPVCWQTECNKGFSEEKEGFTAWVRELSEAFRPRGLLLSAAVSPSKKIIDAGYDIPQLSYYFDWIAVMTYDFHGQWDKKTGHVAPIYYHPDDDFEHFNANFSINYWIEKGAPARKLVMGMPLYGQSFTLENASNSGLNAKAPSPGQAGEFTKAAGFLAYYEICERVNHQGWEVVQDELGRMGPYAHKGTQWVSYDDPDIIRKKAHMVRSLNLGGGMVWALDLDDFRNQCGNGVYPLLRELHDVLKDPPSFFASIPGLASTESTSVKDQFMSSEPETSAVEGESGEADGVTGENENHLEHLELGLHDSREEGGAMQTIEASDMVDSTETSQEKRVDQNKDIGIENFKMESSESIPSLNVPSEFKVVCYFTNWAWYRQGGGKFLPEYINPDLCTHIVYGFAVLNRENLRIEPHDSWADLDNIFYERVMAYRKKGTKVMVAIGGWNDSAGDKYARIVQNSEARALFIRHVLDFIKQYNFDGLDIYWDYPVCWKVGCQKGMSGEKNGFTALVRELSHAFEPKGLILSAAVSPNKTVIDAGYDIPEISRYLDWISVMTYDYHGQWDKQTGHLAPMYDHPEGTLNFNVNFSMNYWITMGTDRRKLVMGIPAYGQSFSLADTTKHQLNAPAFGGGEAGEATRSRGFLAYYEICVYIRQRKWNVVRDTKGRMGPFAYLENQWVSFDDISMILHKSEYIKAMGLGGAMIWAIDLDDFKNYCECESYPILKTINRVLRGFGGPHPKCTLEVRQDTSSAFGNPSMKPTANAPVGAHDIHPQETHNSYLNKTNQPVLPIKCDGKNYLPHESDNNRYYICQNGVQLEQR